MAEPDDALRSGSMNSPWVFAEAYKYRRLRECFSLSKYWVEYGSFTPTSWLTT
jgi:hypothetical protein